MYRRTSLPLCVKFDFGLLIIFNIDKMEMSPKNIIQYNVFDVFEKGLVRVHISHTHTQNFE